MRDPERMLQCRSCQHVFAPTKHTKARWAAAGAGAILGGVATESVVGAVVIGGLCYGAASAADAMIFARRCPECGARGEVRAGSEETRDIRERTSNGGRPVTSAEPPVPSPV